MPNSRRLAAILFADIVGYSQLIADDEEGTLERLKAVRTELIDPKIAEHRGRIVKVLGDGWLVEFSGVVSALHCAVELQARMAERVESGQNTPVKLRIGIHQADIVVEDGDLLGHGVNIAERIQRIAEP